MNKKTTQTTTENVVNEAEDKNLKAGDFFRKARQKASLKLDEVADELKIRKVYLEAIENNDYKNIPEYPYGVGFINSYAKFLGLDSSAMVQKFKNEAYPKKAQEVVNVIKKEKEKEKETASIITSLPTQKNVYIAVGALAIVCLAWIVFSGDDASKTPAQEPVVIENVVSEQVVFEEDSYVAPEGEDEIQTGEDNAVEAPAETVNTAPTTENVADDNVAKIKVFEETWVEVKTPTTLYLSKVLQAGDEYVLPKKEGLILSVGKINGADLFIGDKKMNAVKPTKKINIKLDSFLSDKEEQ